MRDEETGDAEKKPGRFKAGKKNAFATLGVTPKASQPVEAGPSREVSESGAAVLKKIDAAIKDEGSRSAKVSPLSASLLVPAYVMRPLTTLALCSLTMCPDRIACPQKGRPAMRKPQGAAAKGTAAAIAP